MNKKSFWLYVVIMAMAVIAVVLAIVILVVTDNKKPSNQHFKEEVSSQVTKVTESEEYQYVLKYERNTLRIYRNIANEGREVFYDYADINMDSLPDDTEVTIPVVVPPPGKVVAVPVAAAAAAFCSAISI